MSELRDCSAALYDGGWRASDRDELKEYFDFEDSVLDVICSNLAEYEGV